MDKQREMFEAWLKKQGKSNAKSQGGQYFAYGAEIAWRAWQAAIAAQWQPIEAAPKDGTAILAMLPGSDISHSIRWNEINRGWCLTWGGWKLGQYNQPTRWMPMPPEPIK